MMDQNVNLINKKNVEQLTRSLERLTLYDGKGKKRNLNIQSNQNFEKILGGLTMDKIKDQM
jgi:hypothetical protein